MPSLVWSQDGIDNASRIDNSLIRIDTLLSNNSNEDAYKELSTIESKVLDSGTLDQFIFYYKLKGDYYLGEDQYEKSIEAYSNLLQHKKEDLSKETTLILARAINDLGIAFMRTGKFNDAKLSHFSSQILYDKFDEPQGGSYNYLNLGLIYKEEKLLDSSIYYVEKGNNSAKLAEDTIGIGVSYANLGGLYADNGEPVKALDNFNQSLRIFEEIQNDRWTYHIKRLLANTYMKIHDLASAKPLLFDILHYYENRNDNRRVGQLKTDLGDLYLKQNQYDSAFIFLQKGIELLVPTNYTKGILKGYHLLAEYYAKKGDYEKALKNYQTSLSYSGDVFKGMTTNTLMSMANIYRHQGKQNLALKTANEAITASDGSPGAGSQRSYYELMYKIHREIGDQTKALEYLEKWDQAKSESFNQERANEIARIEYANRLERERTTQKAQQQQREFEYRQEIERQQWIKYSVIVIATLLAIIAFISYRSFKRKQEDNFLLEEKNENLKTLRVREQQLSEEAISAKERELATMAMSTHEKNSLLQELEHKVCFLETRLDDNVRLDLKEMRKTISDSYSLDKSWDSFLHKFEGVHPHFFDKLKDENPNLTINDLKLSAYLKIGMSNKEIANVTHLTVGSVKSSINRLKKKLKMHAEDSIRDFVFKYA